LREYGETDEEIDAMKPAEARALLEYFESFIPSPDSFRFLAGL
jgi:hypothetical protein